MWINLQNIYNTAIHSGNTEAITSTITLLEVLVHPHLYYLSANQGQE
jgi:hypothetical protein